MKTELKDNEIYIAKMDFRRVDGTISCSHLLWYSRNIERLERAIEKWSSKTPLHGSYFLSAPITIVTFNPILYDWVGATTDYSWWKSPNLLDRLSENVWIFPAGFDKFKEGFNVENPLDWFCGYNEELRGNLSG